MTAHAAATDIQNRPRIPTGENPQESNPAGTARSVAARSAGFHSTTLASLIASVHFSGCARPGFSFREKKNWGKPPFGKRKPPPPPGGGKTFRGFFHFPQPFPFFQ